MGIAQGLIKDEFFFFSHAVNVFLVCLPVNLNLEVVVSRAYSTTTTETKKHFLC